MIYAIFHVLHLDFSSRFFHRPFLLGIPYLIQLEIRPLLQILKIQLMGYFVKKNVRRFSKSALGILLFYTQDFG